VGPQASFGEINFAASQAVSAAQDAVSQARQLGFGPGTPLYYDMEAYPGTLNGRVLRFLTSWTRELHTLGYSSGVYSNEQSGTQALASNYTNMAYTMPDVIYDALWNGAASTLDPILSSTQWAGHHRVHQYQGGQNVTYGSATINIDKDYLDVQQGVTGGSPQASQAAAQSAGDVDTFFKGTNGKLYHDWYAPGSGWHGPVSMGGSLATQPSTVASVPGNVAVFAKARNGRLVEASYAPGTNWSGLRQLKPPLGPVLGRTDRPGHGQAGQCPRGSAQWRDRCVLERRQQSSLARPVQRGYLGRPGQPGRCGQLGSPAS
jgi:Domain of unknown function (DUF1906)